MITKLLALLLFVTGSIFGAAMVNNNATEKYRDLQREYNQKMMLRDVGRGSIYEKK